MTVYDSIRNGQKRIRKFFVIGYAVARIHHNGLFAAFYDGKVHSGGFLNLPDSIPYPK